MNTRAFRQHITALMMVMLAFCLYPRNTAAAQAEPSLPGQFAYVQSQSLYLVQGDLNKPILIAEVSYGSVVSNPRFSHDGRRLAYCIHELGKEDYPTIYYLDTLTFERYRVPTGGSCSYDWSPDGSRLIYTQPAFMGLEPQIPDGIWMYSVETRASELFLPTQSAIIDPRWSPDGSLISYFDFCFECVGQFYTYEIATGETREWSQRDSDWYIGPDVAWSPDGQSLAFDKDIWVYSFGDQAVGLHLGSRDGQYRTELFSMPARSLFFPLWSPDGKRLAFSSFENFVTDNTVQHRADLMTVAADGSDARWLYGSSHEIFPQAWSPDSQYILFTEWLAEPEVSETKQQVVLVEAETGAVLWQQTSYAYSTADWAVLPAADDSNIPQSSSLALAGQSGILFLTPDHALAFYQPEMGQVERLTEPFLGDEYSISPDGRTILFGNKMISLTGSPAGRILASSIETSLPSDFLFLEWAPDSQYYAYATDDHQVWLQDLEGNRQQLPNGMFPPQWSYDGHWLAQCDDAGQLWLGEAGKPLEVVAQSTHCYISWSPTENLLAYVLDPSDDYLEYAAGIAYLYDPLTRQNKQIAENLSGAGWAPDGRLVSINRTTWIGASSYGYEISAVNPVTGQELTIEEFDGRMSIYPGWMQLPDGYIVGSYRFTEDLGSKEQLADIVFDVTRDGRRMLLGNSDNGAVDVECRDRETNTTHWLLRIDLGDTPGAAMPGMSGRLSPDGNWMILGDFDGEKTVNWLAQCGSSAPVKLPSIARSGSAYFSPDSAWLVMEQTNLYDGPIPTIYIQELQSGRLEEIQAGTNTVSHWFRMPEPEPVVPIEPSPELLATVNAEPMSPEAQDLSQRESPGDTALEVDSWALLIAILGILLLLGYFVWSQTSNARYPSAQIAPVVTEPAPAATPGLQPAQQNTQAVYQQGVQFIRQGNTAEGMLALRQIIDVEPENSHAWFWLGIACLKQNSYRSAERCFLQAKKHGHPEADKALEWLKNQHP